MRLVLLVALLALTPGCLTVHAALQAAQGQLQLLAAKKPIQEVIDNPRTPKRLRRLLAEIARIKRYGEQQGLLPTANYEEYVQLRRRSVVYVVSACEPLRFRSKTWSFPIAGEFPYLGWFSLGSAQDYARDLEAEGWDVTDDKRRPLRMLGQFSSQLWLALRGVAGTLPRAGTWTCAAPPPTRRWAGSATRSSRA